MRRRRSSSAEATARMEAAWEAQDDWRSVCRVCGAQLVGTLASITSHKCPDAVDDRATFSPRSLPQEAAEARRLPSPISFLLGEQDRPDISAKARVAHAVRVLKTTR